MPFSNLILWNYISYVVVVIIFLSREDKNKVDEYTNFFSNLSWKIIQNILLILSL